MLLRQNGTIRWEPSIQTLLMEHDGIKAERGNDYSYEADYGDNVLHVVLHYYNHYLGV